ncbi:hypothetical protein FOA52_005709 [Chlamydomonas sp. UWO 241]|nr:hypothetical protein FOA52_005709 [Chlamydomonas sp. UWO 241]
MARASDRPIDQAAAADWELFHRRTPPGRTTVQAHGPGAKRNFPGEANSELPVSLGEERKQRCCSRFIGVSWHKASSSWSVKLREPHTKRQQHIGCYAS